MTEQRWKDPAGNEWVTIDEPSDDVKAGWPKGTVEVPMIPIPARSIQGSDVDAERDKRIASGFLWRGKLYQARQFDLDNIRSMAGVATMALATGQDDTSYRWFKSDTDFAWWAADNTPTKMTLSDMVDFATTAAKWGSDHIIAGIAIKATPGGIPTDYNANSRWPEP